MFQFFQGYFSGLSKNHQAGKPMKQVGQSGMEKYRFFGAKIDPLSQLASSPSSGIMNKITCWSPEHLAGTNKQTNKNYQNLQLNNFETMKKFAPRPQKEVFSVLCPPKPSQSGSPVLPHPWSMPVVDKRRLVTLRPLGTGLRTLVGGQLG